MLTVTLSSKYQVVIPQAIRQSLGLQPGQKYHPVQYGDRIELIPVTSPQSARGFLSGIDTSVPSEPDRL